MKRFILIITIAIFSISAQAKAPKAPSDLKIVDVTQNSIAIAWRDNSDNEKGFRVYREDSNKRAFRLIKTLPPNSTFYRDTGLRPFTAYRYQVRAFNDDGEGISSTMSATTSKKAPSYTFYPASIFEIPQYDPYKIHVEISFIINMRIILSWGANISDLDSHLIKYINDNLEYHIYYGDPYGTNGDNLDRDVTDRYGPETITIKEVNSHAKYIYFVYNYSNETDIKSSDANVKVLYVGKEQIFYPPSENGRYWKVFTIENGKIIPCTSNCMSNNINDILR